MLCLLEVEESTAPHAGLIHRVQIVADRVFAPEPDTQHAGDVAAQLRGQRRAKVALLFVACLGRGSLRLGQSREVSGRERLEVGVKWLHELFPNVVNHVVPLAGRHPRLRAHQAAAVGERAKHRVRVGAELQLAGAERARDRERGRSAVGAVAVYA